MFGRKLTVQELENWGMVNRIFEAEGFHESVKRFLEEQLKENDGKSMMETKRLQNLPLREGRMVAVYNSMDALAERFVDGAPLARFVEKKKVLEGESFMMGFGWECADECVKRNQEVDSRRCEECHICHMSSIVITGEKA